MSTLPFISQMKSLVQAKLLEISWTAFQSLDGIVHFAMGDTEEGIEAEESATRSLAVIGAAALAGATGGAALPVLAAVVAGVAADGILTGIESTRHHKYDPQGMIGVGTNVVKDFSQRKEDKLGGDVFDGVVIAASDGLIGKGGVKIRAGATTRIFRVEGKSLIRQGDGSHLGHFTAGDKQRTFYHNGEIAPRERLPPPSTAESLPTAHLPLEPEPRPGGVVSKAVISTDQISSYKLLDHRDLVKKYKELYHDDVPSNVTEKAHDIRVKSFEVLTRDLNQI
ncbi:hypothetical protein AB1N83_005357 [Pleurotus pulmonarius]